MPHSAKIIAKGEKTMGQYEKRGYLNSEFRLFHLTDTETKEIEYHYHEFDKITILIRGRVNYIIEGKSYELKPYDIVLVKHNDIHRLVVDNHFPYERIIVYISPNFMNAYKTEDYDLNCCFLKAEKAGTNVLRIPSLEKSSLFRSITRLERSFSDDAYAAALYRQVLFIEFMIHLSRAAQGDHLEFIDTDACNPKIIDILEYIGSHLSDELTIDGIAGTFFISRYYMMRLFKQETGCTIGNYISQKRLLLGRELILSGTSAAQAAYECGYKDYSTFQRAYKALFKESPRDTLLTLS
ncbi:transcriptional regulator, AraC family [[Clostridium] hylemonae DSM 15053]|uniref:Transcriptional regulator, AraC family n=2 Tax=[Clostridium] hylemonae TaxID=89153 RepID=C0C477_9FIRM|nr:transcriptional regulator, AraC family [[Clostridium] hylemonae DSM 15053]